MVDLIIENWDSLSDYQQNIVLGVIRRVNVEYELKGE